MWSSLEKLSLSPAGISASSQSTKMALVAVAASVTTAAVLLGYQGTQRKQRSKKLKDDLGLPKGPIAPLKPSRSLEITTGHWEQQTRSSHHQRTGSKEEKITFDEELVLEQLARNIAFLGEEGVQKLRDSFVVIVGAGGIGSWAASMLIKSGVGKVRIIDFDQISLSGLNQHATATRTDIGTPKAVAMKKHFRLIAPWVKVDARVERLQEDSADQLLSGDLHTKLQLLKYCYEHKIRVISSMGAGAKADPSRVQIGDISETFEDPLARAVRRRLKKLGVDTGIEVVFSSEKPYRTEPLSTEQDSSDGDDNVYKSLPNFGPDSLLPILCPLPAMFGMSMATFIICKIAGWNMEPLSVKFRMELYQRLHRNLKSREESLYPVSGSGAGSAGVTFPLNRQDVGYLVEEMFRGKSAVSGSMDQIAVCRWKQDEPLSLLNTVVLTEKELEKHLALPKDANLEEVYGKDVVEYVEARFREEEQISRL
ncbi:hypothetical protein BGZ54_006370 [Gamsiella multidivaricata]|nr:hypothetical protein BGZ54_006370 [Gamsiella multidivaricata]